MNELDLTNNNAELNPSCCNLCGLDPGGVKINHPEQSYLNFSDAYPYGYLPCGIFFSYFVAVNISFLGVLL